MSIEIHNCRMSYLTLRPYLAVECYLSSNLLQRSKEEAGKVKHAFTSMDSFPYWLLLLSFLNVHGSLSSPI